MAATNVRLNAVIAALEKVRDHITDIADDNAAIEAVTYNRWIAMLDGVVEGNWKNLELDEDDYVASDMLMHVDAAIAFLTAHRDA